MCIFNGLKISQFLGMHGNTCQVCFSDCNQWINKGEVYMVIKQSRIMHIKLKANHIKPQQWSQSLEHNKVSSIHHWDRRKWTQNTNNTQKHTESQNFTNWAQASRHLVGASGRICYWNLEKNWKFWNFLAETNPILTPTLKLNIVLNVISEFNNLRWVRDMTNNTTHKRNTQHTKQTKQNMN